MKEKIGQALQKKIDEMMAKGEYDEHLIKQMTLINHADICTIDSFCLRIVKEYFARVELDCAFGIADDTEMKIIKHDVMDQVMEMCYEDESVVPGFDRLIMTFARNESDSAVPDIVERIIKVISSYPEPKKWLAQAADDPVHLHQTQTVTLALAGSKASGCLFQLFARSKIGEGDIQLLPLHLHIDADQPFRFRQL